MNGSFMQQKVNLDMTETILKFHQIRFAKIVGFHKHLDSNSDTPRTITCINFDYVCSNYEVNVCYFCMHMLVTCICVRF